QDGGGDPQRRLQGGRRPGLVRHLQEGRRLRRRGDGPQERRARRREEEVTLPPHPPPPLPPGERGSKNRHTGVPPEFRLPLSPVWERGRGGEGAEPPCSRRRGD